MFIQWFISSIQFRSVWHTIKTSINAHRLFFCFKLWLSLDINDPVYQSCHHEPIFWKVLWYVRDVSYCKLWMFNLILHLAHASEDFKNNNFICNKLNKLFLVVVVYLCVLAYFTNPSLPFSDIDTAYLLTSVPLKVFSLLEHFKFAVLASISMIMLSLVTFQMIIA